MTPNRPTRNQPQKTRKNVWGFAGAGAGGGGCRSRVQTRLNSRSARGCDQGGGWPWPSRMAPHTRAEPALIRGPAGNCGACCAPRWLKTAHMRALPAIKIRIAHAHCRIALDIGVCMCVCMCAGAKAFLPVEEATEQLCNHTRLNSGNFTCTNAASRRICMQTSSVRSYHAANASKSIFRSAGHPPRVAARSADPRFS